MKNNRFNSVDIRNVIRERLKLQTNQRNLINRFDIPYPSYETITSSSFISRLRLWDELKRKSFYLLVGGDNYLPLTKTLFEEYLRIRTPEINVTKGENIKELVKE